MSLQQLAEKVPVIRAEGSSYEIGKSIGSQAAERIAITLEHLKVSSKKYTGQDWEQCVAMSRVFVANVKAYDPRYLEEIQGLADGSGFSFDDIFTLNCRTEIGMQFQYQRGINYAESLKRIAGGCSVVGANQTRTASKTTIYGQNWDYPSEQYDTLVFVIVKQQDRPSIAWIGEAGLICRMAGINSRGIGLGGNSLFTNQPINYDGLPLQFTYRAIMDSETFARAVSAAARCQVASCNNLMICGPEGEMVNMENESGGYRLLYMKDGLICHANSFYDRSQPSAPWKEIMYPEDILRDFRLNFLTEKLREKPVTPEDIMGILSDHGVNAPDASICQHLKDCTTVTSSVSDLCTKDMWISVGPPCGGYIHLRPFDE